MSFPSEVAWIVLNSPTVICDNTCEVSSTRKAHQGKPWCLGFYEGHSHRHTAPVQLILATQSPVPRGQTNIMSQGLI